MWPRLTFSARKLQASFGSAGALRLVSLYGLCLVFPSHLTIIQNFCSHHYCGFLKTKNLLKLEGRDIIPSAKNRSALGRFSFHGTLGLFQLLCAERP